MSTPEDDRLRSIKTFPSLVKYLRDELEWPIDSDDFDELTFDYEPEELGLDAKTAVKIKDIKQLRPLASNQPWGIFFVNFEPKRLPVVVLRRILRSLVLKKRQSANKPQQAAWQLHDLLFISAYGESEHRDITLANFSDDSGVGDLPTLKVLGWDDEDTVLHLAYAHDVLKEKLQWPDNPADLDNWRRTWSQAFTLKHREVIGTSREMAERMAELATAIRKRVNRVLAVESEKGPMRKLMTAFREALIHDLSEDDFADMYAQTITYGLLSARVSRPAGLVADNIRDMVPITNPFLRDLLSSFLTVGGRKGKVDFDELGINDVVQALRDADMEAVLRDFGDKNRQEDPVIFFYELFLKEYDPKKRMQRGVFYTPRPVVSFIVRSVDEILRKEFGLADGLADTITWGEMVKRHPEISIPTGAKPEDPFVQILDPACGTGTFLVEVIDVIHQTMKAKWRSVAAVYDRRPRLDFEFHDRWNEYVSDHLLPRLYGFELMMAPYAIAHMKIGLKLFETGYSFRSHERARIYLTNSLEPPQDFSDRFEFDAPALAHEAQAVNAIKRHQRFTVVIGNPPYSNYGQLNKIPFILELLEDYKKGLGERKINLDDDFIKFVRFSQWIIDTSTCGILTLITNNTYLDGIAHRLMRRSLLESFSKIWINDLHGSARRNETSIEGVFDENVFDIQQGVAIGVFVKRPFSSVPSEVSFSECWGTRDAKYKRLAQTTAKTGVSIGMTPKAERFYLVPHALEGSDEYELYWSIADIFPVFSSGIDTKIDRLLIDSNSATLATRLADILNPANSISEVRRKYEIPPTSTWEISRAKTVRFKKECITPITYRFFDSHYTYFDEKVLSRARQDVMQHLRFGENIGLISARQQSQRGQGWTLVGVSNKIIERCAISSNTREGNYLFPLWLYSDEQDLVHSRERRPNLKPQFPKALGLALRVAQKMLTDCRTVSHPKTSFITPTRFFTALATAAATRSFSRLISRACRSRRAWSCSAR
jgi:predicted helicase